MDTSAQKNVVLVPALSVSKRFGRFKDEDEKAVRKPGVKANPALEGMMQAWEGKPGSPRPFRMFLSVRLKESSLDSS